MWEVSVKSLVPNHQTDMFFFGFFCYSKISVFYELEIGLVFKVSFRAMARIRII